MEKRKLKIGLISSRGGHLFQLIRLKKWWGEYNHFWVVVPGKDVDSLLPAERVYYAAHPESRHLLNAIKNTLLAISILLSEKPDIVVSCGAGVAPPFFLVAKILGMKLIFIEPYDFVQYPSLTGRMIYPFTNHFYVQHREQLKFYPKAKYKGSLL